jgi:hypothetical protein
LVNHGTLANWEHDVSHQQEPIIIGLQIQAAAKQTVISDLLLTTERAPDAV